jgi:nucleotide-binding universal stress UspA family protein
MARKSVPQEEYHSPELEDVAAALDTLTFGLGRSEAPEQVEAPQVRRILLATDGSPGFKPALAWAGELAKLYSADLSVTSVCPSPEVARALHAGTAGWRTVQVAFDECDDLAEATLARAAKDLRSMGVRAAAELQRGRPAHAIVELSKSLKSDLVVLGSHGHGAGERLNLGSVGTAVKHHVPCSVLIARGPPNVKRVLLATDGSLRSHLAVGFGLDLAKRLHAKPILGHCVDMTSYGLTRTRQARFAQELAARSDLEDLARGVPGATFRITVGPAARRLRELATRERAGLVVVGSRGLGGLKGLALGSVSDALTHKAPTSVLAVKPRAR